MKARIKFRKYGVMKFIGHLDVMRFFQKVMRRAEIPIAFTGGYSPHMIMSFAQPLGVGVTSDGEYLDIELTEFIPSKRAVEQLNSAMVKGIEVISFVEIPDDKKCSGMTIVAAADYKVTLLESAKSSDATKPVPKEWQMYARQFMNQPQIVVWKKSKRSEMEVDIKPMMYKMQVDADGIYLLLATGSEQNLKPALVMETFFRYIGIELEKMPFHIHRIEMYAKDEKEHGFVSLENLGSEIL